MPAGVTVIGEETHAPYNRVLLAEVLAGRYAAEVIALPPAEVRRGVRVVRIDRADRLRALRRRRRRAVRRGWCWPPGRTRCCRRCAACSADAANAGRACMRSARWTTASRCGRPCGRYRPGVRAVVIGGGLLGVSAARALAASRRPGGAGPAGRAPHGAAAGRASRPGCCARHLESLGVEVHTECRVRGLRCADGAVRGRCELADGYELAPRSTVLACGVRPRTGLAQAAGLDVRKGIVVDDELRTSDPYIHAVGDCAEHRGAVYGLAGPALEQADVLAAACWPGRPRPLRGDPRPDPAHPARSAVGRRPRARSTWPRSGRPEPLPGDDVVRLADATRGAYRKVVVRGDRLVGGVLLGDLATVGALARTWEDDEPLPPTASLLHLLTNDGGS